MTPIPEDDYSLLHIERISQYVPLPPASLTSVLPSICTSVFSPLLLTYYPPVGGIVLAYENVRLSEQPPQSAPQQKKSKKSRHRREATEAHEVDAAGGADEGIVLLRQTDEYAAPFVWATASLLVWRPQMHTWIPATVTHQSSTHLTFSHLNTFPISVLRAHMPADWEWHTEEQHRKKKGWDGRIADEGGWWVDGEGGQVQNGAEMRIRIREWDVRSGSGGEKGVGSLRVGGSLLSAEEEGVREEQRRGKRREGAKDDGDNVEGRAV